MTKNRILLKFLIVLVLMNALKSVNAQIVLTRSNISPSFPNGTEFIYITKSLSGPPQIIDTIALRFSSNHINSPTRTFRLGHLSFRITNNNVTRMSVPNPYGSGASLNLNLGNLPAPISNAGTTQLFDCYNGNSYSKSGNVSTSFETIIIKNDTIPTVRFKNSQVCTDVGSPAHSTTYYYDTWYNFDTIHQIPVVFVEFEQSRHGINLKAYQLDSIIPPNTVGLLENKVKLCSVYPNPSNGILNLKSNQKITGVEIFSSHGNLVEKKTINSIHFELDLKDLKSGFYYIKVSFDNNISELNPILVKN